MKLLWQTLAGAGVLGVLDAVWLNGPGGALYRRELGATLRLDQSGTLKPLWPAVIPVYVLLLIGLLVLVAPRAGASWLRGAAFGGLFGAVTYGVYDFTNLALVAGWTTRVAVIDVVWGSVLCAAVGAVMALVAR